MKLIDFRVQVYAQRYLEPDLEERTLEILVDVPGWRFRSHMAWGVPLGARMGIWNTSSRSMRLRGFSLRVGRRMVGPCLTLRLLVFPSPSIKFHQLTSGLDRVG